MRVPLKLNAIEQEHLQELYDAAGVARDELPYSPKFDEVWQGFQDRTFKNAEREQVFGAILKYVRSSSNAASAEEGRGKGGGRIGQRGRRVVACVIASSPLFAWQQRQKTPLSPAPGG